MTSLNTVNRDIVVLDTSVILYNADCIFGFKNNDIVIPLVVLGEVDKFRNLDSETGRNSRKFIRSLNSLISLGGNLSDGVVRLDTGELVRVQTSSGSVQPSLDLSENDDKILSVCFDIEQKKDGYNREITLITRDVALAVRANVLGVNCRDYSEDKLVSDISDLYSGTLEIEVDSESIDILHDKGFLVPAENWMCFIDRMYPNMGVTLISKENPKHTGLSIYRNGRLEKLRYSGEGICNIVPKNREQTFALELLMDESVKAVSLTGPSGTGKTLLAVMSALHQVDGLKRYEKVVISRPIQPLGRDLGYLPGGADEKMDVWISPIRDAIEFAFDGAGYRDFVNFGIIEIEPLTYIRGRSLPKTLFILDEAQQINRHEIKTVLTRISEGSKIILTGDILQIDNNYLDTMNNGLTVAIEKFKSYDIVGHITLTKGQRSELASLASKIL